MDRDTAATLLQHYLTACEALNEATALVGAVLDEEEQRQIRRPIGEVGAAIYVDLMRPIIRQYPELDPDRAPI